MVNSFQYFAQRQSQKGHPLSAVRDCLFSVLAAILHTGGRFSSHNLSTRHDRHPPIAAHSDYINTYGLFTATKVARTRLIVTLCVHWLSSCFTRPVLATNPSFSLETDVRRCSIRPNPATGGSSKPPGSNENRAVRVCGATFQSLCGLLCNFVDRVVSLGATIGFEL